MQIKSIPMWTGSHDNYAYLVVDDKTKDAMIVDPANPPEVLPYLEKTLAAEGITLKGIINTHHHYDHAGGNKELLKRYPVQILGGKDCEGVTKVLKDGETFTIGKGINVKSLHTPCHTQDSICYFAQDGDEKAVFTGDTLFIAGCGRFFEGTPEEMHKALNVTLASLPDDTKVYPGHEYTKSNIKFGQHVTDTVPVQKLSKFCAENEQTQGKFTIGDEKQHNVFMRVDDPAVQQATGEIEPVAVMKKLREMKNSFK
ncbi:beta-lactamase-like protein [Morchella snyderi]|nr:beta-lactamase-like protein [Morchella snyderi]